VGGASQVRKGRKGRKKKMLKMTKRSRYVIENKRRRPENHIKTNPFLSQTNPFLGETKPFVRTIMPHKPIEKPEGSVPQVSRRALEGLQTLCYSLRLSERLYQFGSPMSFYLA
jgi:hypothetical protein